MHFGWWALVGALVLAAAASFLLPRARGYVRHGVEITLEDVQLGSAGAALVGGDLQVRLRVRNATLLPVRVREARYQVQVGGRPFGQGKWTPAGGVLYFAPGEAAVIVASVDPEAAAVLGTLWDRLRGRDVPIAVKGEVVADILIGSIAVPFEVSRVRRD
jgi:Late embryogenesis abundant protein